MSTEIMHTASKQLLSCFCFAFDSDISEMADMRCLIARKCVHEISTKNTLIATVTSRDHSDR